MIIVDHQIAKLCQGIVPEELITYYSYHFGVELPSHVQPMVDPFDPSLVNPASLDIRVGNTALWRNPSTKSGYYQTDLSIYTEKHPVMLHSGDRLLVDSLELINLPNFLTAQFKLKSSRAREGFDHALAGFADPGWHNSRLTMELVSHDPEPLPLWPGKRIGQFVFSLTLGVPEKSYAAVGRYNGDVMVSASKG